MSGLLWVGLLGAGLIGFATAWRWMQHRQAAITQGLELRLKLRERDLRLAEERLRRLESERWRPAAVAAPGPVESAEVVEVDADGLPKRAVPAAVQAELLGLQHRCAEQAVELAQTRRDLATRSAEVANLRSVLDARSRRAESGGKAGEQGGAGG